MNNGGMVQVRRPSGNVFGETPKAEIPRAQFDLSHGLKTTFDSDRIVPILVREVYPADTITCRMTGFARIFSPLKAPIMDNIHLDFFFFYVPYRLLWTNWEKFNGAQDNPGDSTDYTIPVLSTGTVTTGCLGDYMGLPVGADPGDNDISALPFRANRLIYNEWFRDQNLVSSAGVAVGDGPDSATYFTDQPFKRAKRPDYFTSCLPWPQKGTAVSLPLGTTAPIVGLGTIAQTDQTGPQTVYETGGSTSYSDYFKTSFVDLVADSDGHPTTPLPVINADLSTASAATINELRQAFQIQRLLERDARSGTRYVEILKSHWDVTSPDFRLQRPEYLGGGKAMLNVSPIAQTGETGTTPQGTLTAVGTGGINGVGFAKSFVEHGVIIGYVSARPDLTYQQGIPRWYSRQTRYDFPWPALAHIGEQAVLKKELYVTGTATDDEVFGYQERYAECRQEPSRLSGKFRSDATGTLDLWHVAQDFASQPALNQTFIEYDTPMSRVQAVTTEPDFIADFWFDMKAAMALPLYGVPGFLDHF